ncbi:MAG: hypothetical protein KatS3mg090_0162 [Patescibacteria group bacterium]|nr:MAG: hypothetical protein KatS3mg090_0162 [Patescibacteria group bacterium]
MKKRITITLDSSLLNKIDNLASSTQGENRSSIIEKYLSEYFQTNIKTAVVLAGDPNKTANQPVKSLLKIKNKPAIYYILKKLEKSGIQEVFICIDKNTTELKTAIKPREFNSLKLNFVLESKRLDTGGAIKQLRTKLLFPFLVYYADILTNLDIGKLLNFHATYKPLATVVVSPSNKPDLYGQITLEGINLLKFYGKQHQQKSVIVNTGIYILDSEIFRYFPNQDRFELDAILKKLIPNKNIIGYITNSTWLDLGNNNNIDEYIKNLDLED